MFIIDDVCIYSEYYGYMDRGFGRGGRRGRGGRMMVRKSLELLKI